MPKAINPTRGYLTVTTDIWGASRRYTAINGRVVMIGFYQEARDYAKAHGFKGIRISYKGSRSKDRIGADNGD